MATEQQIKEAFDALFDYQESIFNHNKNLIKSIGYEDLDLDVKQMTEDCEIGKMEIVDFPNGEIQHESYNHVNEVYVDQWHTGYHGDTYKGDIYGKLPDGRYLKIPYSFN